MAKQYLYIFKTYARKYRMFTEEEHQEYFESMKDSIECVFVGKDSEGVCIYDCED